MDIRGTLQVASDEIRLRDGASNQTTVKVHGSSSNQITLTLPSLSASDTLVSKTSTDTLTNKTLTAPVMTTPTLGVATATSVNKLTLTAPATSATLTLADGSTLVTAGAYSVTLTATAATALTLPTTGTLATLAGSETLTNKTLTSPAITTPTGIVKGDVGLGNVDNTSDATKDAATATLTNKTLTAPVMTAPVLGVATATSINKVALTAPASGATLTLADGATLATVGAYSVTFTATAATAVTLPTTGTLATLAGSETLTNKTLTSPAITTPTGIVKGDVGLGNVDNTSDSTKNAAAVALTNKTINGASNTLTVRLANDVSGTLPILNGGTGQTVANDALNALLPSQASASGKVLTSDGSNTSWSPGLTTTLADGKIFLGNVSNVATAVTPTGDVTMTNAGVTAIASGVIVNADVSGSAAIDGSKLVAATASLAGAVSAATQSFGGGKTIDGNADEIQLKVQGHSTQTNNVLVVEKSDGTDLFTVNNSGGIANQTASTATSSVYGVMQAAGLLSLNRSSATISSNNITVGTSFVTMSGTGNLNTMQLTSPLAYAQSMVLLKNSGGGTITIIHNTGSPTAARFNTPSGASIALADGEKILMIYDDAAGGGGGAWIPMSAKY